MRAHRNIVCWYFETRNALCDESAVEWMKYRDIEMQIIEDAYQRGKTDVFLDKYRIDLKELIGFNKSDPAQYHHVRRETNCMSEEYLREERFFSPPVLTSMPSYGSAQIWCPFLSAWLDTAVGKRALLNFSSAMDACIEGIFQEAIKCKNDCISEAEWMAEQLRECKTKSRHEITKLCIHLYTRESFLYRILNATLRSGDHSKLATLGLCFFLQGFSHTGKGFYGIVYRGVHLSPSDILTYKQAMGLWRSWPSFTSTTKNRRMAEIRGNTLFIIRITQYKFNYSSVRGYEITEISQFPDEEEVLLPAGISFQIITVKNDSSDKTLIEIKI